MKIEGSYTFEAPRDVVWQAMLDPAVLARVMPGCERLEQVGDNEYEGVMNIRMGPMQGQFQGKITLLDIEPPNQYRMRVNGSGPLGFVNGEGSVRLESGDDGESAGTTIHYAGDAQVGGRIASVGQRLMDRSAKALTDQSLQGMDQQIQARQQAATAAETATEPPPLPDAPSPAAFAAGVAKSMVGDAVSSIPTLKGSQLFLGPIWSGPRRDLVMAEIAADSWLLKRPRVWWERLVFDTPIEEHQQCPNCQTANDSIDVVCTNDDITLVGRDLTDGQRGILINVLRGLAIAVAIAVGYWHWLWPAYIYAGALVIGFFGLFLRHHRTALVYFLIVTIGCLAGQGIWQALDPEGTALVTILVGIVTTFLLFEPIFLAVFILKMGDDSRQGWLHRQRVDMGITTLGWIALTLTLSVLSIVLVPAARALFSGRWLDIYAKNASQIAAAFLGAGTITALVSSTVFSLRAGGFSIPDRWHYRPLLRERQLRRVPPPSPVSSPGRLDRVVLTIKRILVTAINRIIETVENTYNYFIVRFVNNLAASAVKLTNLVRRTIIKTIRHMVRTFLRFLIVSYWAISWALMAARHYSQSFVIPALFSWVAAIYLYGASQDFFDYTHGGFILMPLVIVLKATIVIVLFTITGSLLTRVGIFRFSEKVLSALSVFGTYAYLFFLLSAWLLGIIGTLTAGPYRIGWVTIANTITVVVIFVLTQRRSIQPA